MPTITRNLKLTLSLVLLISVAVFASDSSIKYPENYRNWTHIKSMLIEEGHPLYSSFGGIHHIYANNQAISGYQTGKFPDGSVIVFDLLESNESDNAISEGNRKVVGVMIKDIKRFQETGGWGFEAFGAGKPSNRAVGTNYKAACFDCHTSQAQNDYVFSKLRE